MLYCPGKRERDSSKVADFYSAYNPGTWPKLFKLPLRANRKTKRLRLTEQSTYINADDRRHEKHRVANATEQRRKFPDGNRAFAAELANGKLHQKERKSEKQQCKRVRNKECTWTKQRLGSLALRLVSNSVLITIIACGHKWSSSLLISRL